MNTPQDEVISRYSDDQAVEDGVLVELTARDRMTSNCLAWLEENIPVDGSPPNNWPVPLFDWIGARGDKTRRAICAAKGLVGSFSISYCERQPDQSWAGHAMYAGANRIGQLLRPDAKRGDRATYKVLWIHPNECGGVTLMLPEDY